MCIEHAALHCTAPIASIPCFWACFGLRHALRGKRYSKIGTLRTRRYVSMFKVILQDLINLVWCIIGS